MMALLDFLLFGNIYIPILIVLSLLVYYSFKKTPVNLPPGPIGLPIFGYLPFISRPVHLAFNRLANKYGHIFYVRLGNRVVIVLNDYVAIKEAFVKQAEVFAGRIYDANFFEHDQDRIGLLAVDGEEWRQHRRFVLSNMRDNGVGKLTLEPLLHNEIHCFISELNKTCGKPSSMKNILGCSILNNVYILVTGQRYDYDDPTILKMVQTVFSLTENGDTISLPTFLPWIKSIPFLSLLAKVKIRWQCINDVENMTKKVIDDLMNNRSNMQYENLSDAYMAEMQNQKLQAVPSSFSMNGLVHICRDLVVAGTETTAKTLLWGMIYLTNHPEVQKKVQSEIDRVIGHGRDPSYNDRSNTPYTVATLTEIHRLASLVPLALPHRTTRDTNLFGYHIPKNSMVFANTWAVHNDPKLWGDPENFRPERFLGPDGQLVIPEHFIPFSIGKRACAGEPLARMELYLYLTSILQNFNLVKFDGCKLPLDYFVNVARSPTFDVICVEKREIL